MIDFYKVLGCTPETVKDGHIKDLQTHEEVKSYPPRFKLLFSPDGSHSGNTQVKLRLHGLSNAFSITVRLGKINIIIILSHRFFKSSFIYFFRRFRL